MKVVPRKGGGLAVVLSLEEALVIETLPSRLRSVFEDPTFHERATKRLFPAVYREDEAEEAECRRLLGDDLRRRKLAQVDAFAETLRRSKVRSRSVEILLQGDEFAAWLGFINDMRLFLGCELGIESEDWGRDFDPEHPQAHDLALLHFLSWLEEELLRGSGFELGEVDPRDYQNPPR